VTLTNQTGQRKLVKIQKVENSVLDQPDDFSHTPYVYQALIAAYAAVKLTISIKLMQHGKHCIIQVIQTGIKC
jgi:ethanolamine utilization protein EutP (predicted NTPase)